MSAPSAAETDTQAKTIANTSGVTTESLQKTIAEKLEAKHVDIEDMSGKQICSRKSARALLLLLLLTNYQAGVVRCLQP